MKIETLFVFHYIKYISNNTIIITLSLLNKALKYLFIFLVFSPLLVYAQTDILSLKQMSLDELAELDVIVTSASKKPQKLSKTAAAMFVISQEDIKKSGVSTIPDALRMAPGIQVARIDVNKWSVTARGFSGRFANKLHGYEQTTGYAVKLLK